MRAGKEILQPDTALKSRGLRSEWFVFAGLAALILLCYWQVWKFDFVNYDDTDYVTKNAWVQNGLSAESVAWAFTTSHASNWHPLTWLSHMLDWQIYGANAGGHHFTNVLLHIANSLLLFLLFRELTGAKWRSALVAALFAIHPVHVESVAWVSERKDVLSTFFGLISIWFYVKYARAQRLFQSTQKETGSFSIFYSIALLFFALSLMSKPMLVTLPFVLLLLDFWPLKRFAIASGTILKSENGTLGAEFSIRFLLEKLPFLLLTIASCVVTFKVQSGKTVQTLSDFSVVDRIFNVLVSYVAYLGKTFWPGNLAFFYPLISAPSAGQVVIAAFILLLIFVAVVLARKKYPFMVTGWLLFLGTLVPVIGFIHVGEQAMADRYTYVPLIGIFFALVWLVSDFVSDSGFKRWLSISTATVLLLALAFATHRQISFWRDSGTLLERALAVTKNNFLAHNNYGVVLAENENFDEAIAHYRRAIEIKPHYARAYSNLGSALTMAGKFTEAVASFEKALSLRPNDAETHYNLAVTLGRLHNFDGAIEHCHKALDLDPNYKTAHFDLGLALSLTGRHSEAVLELQKYLEAFPQDETAQNLLARTVQKMDSKN